MALFAAFRANFVPELAWEPAATPGACEGPDVSQDAVDGRLSVRMSQQHPAAKGVAGFANKKPSLLLPQLDLATLASSKDEPPLSESMIKRNKLALFEKQCSKVCEGLYVSGEAVAKSREALRENGITHVVNCVGAIYPEYWKGDGVEYLTLWLQGEWVSWWGGLLG